MGQDFGEYDGLERWGVKRGAYGDAGARAGAGDRRSKSTHATHTHSYTHNVEAYHGGSLEQGNRGWTDAGRAGSEQPHTHATHIRTTHEA